MKNKKQRTILPGIIATTAIATNLIVAPSAQAEIVKIEQGSYIETNGSYCTIGYVNPETRTALTAGHCNVIERGEDETYNPPFMKSEKDAIYTYKGTKVGKVVKNTYTAHSDLFNGKDVSIIQLEPWVEIGENKYSGDNWANIEDLEKGDKLCSYGGRTAKLRCGEITEVSVEDNLIEADENTIGIVGDSGGPAWVEGKGFVGVYSYSTSAGAPVRIAGFNHPLHYKEEITPSNGTSFEKENITPPTGTQLSSIIENNKRVPATLTIIAIMLSIFFASSAIFKFIVPQFMK